MSLPHISIAYPRWIRRYVDRDYLDLSPSRVLPMAVLLVYGVAVGLVFNTGIDHPYDKLQHLVFFGLLTLAIHALFCCRLRISAGEAMLAGLAGEGVQALTPHHQASLLDVAANSVGVAIVVAAIMLVRAETRIAEEEAVASEGGPAPGQSAAGVLVSSSSVSPSSSS
ncbi:antibiotic resistance protein VanZ [Stappia taiwanensis]|uniref:Antibiotic resistance protein VanZ n=1 Tax=Stappia taiwanensis TaxID=992267 RepID=A0A838XX09_9HYPH|nr:antibiotic resistance protein VanZ [Stappia taiwanensis]MBA4611574.1 antibiotic resistance protein VanZ [Stappia taiwanensis]GGE99215.1 hypothetical protein GCM10007285_28510 [Stappia taiwanensis]